jgi:hypothetical protein
MAGIKLKWVRGTDWMEVTAGETFFKVAVSNKVRIRNLENPEEVVMTIPDGKPYMPKGFPHGLWKVGAPVPKTNPYLAPYYIPTDAWQMVTEWALDADGSYKAPTSRQVRDAGYGIHFSTSSTTLGCLKIINKSDLLMLTQLIAGKQAKGEPVTFEVV